MKNPIIRVECVEDPGETEFQGWRTIIQVWAILHAKECKGTPPLFLGSTVAVGKQQYFFYLGCG